MWGGFCGGIFGVQNLHDIVSDLLHRIDGCLQNTPHTVLKNELGWTEINLHQLGELLPSATSQFPALSTVALATFVAVLLIAILQSDQSSDDDDSGPGDGGLMQPVGMRA
ncbi:MAG: hypothetical protein FJ083_01985 [Cyanobacteria bacterium K_Offshore_surface_m2_239]|nr:hypothetical protein [Cyanobacteria bacterium K_Offshore_surface_m2_239]